jgi:hypothetical protein
MAITRFCFRYRAARHHVRLYDVQIALIEKAVRVASKSVMPPRRRTICHLCLAAC